MLMNSIDTQESQTWTIYLTKKEMEKMEEEVLEKSWWINFLSSNWDFFAILQISM